MGSGFSGLTLDGSVSHLAGTPGSTRSSVPHVITVFVVAPEGYRRNWKAGANILSGELVFVDPRTVAAILCPQDGQFAETRADDGAEGGQLFGVAGIGLATGR
jgi:hypothetical protein